MWRGSSLTEPLEIRWLGGEGGGDPIGTMKGWDAMFANMFLSDGDSIDRREVTGECPSGNGVQCGGGTLKSAALYSGVDDDDEEDRLS